MASKKFLMENLIKNFKKKLTNFIKNVKSDTLSRNLIKSIKKYCIKNFIKNLKTVSYHV